MNQHGTDPMPRYLAEDSSFSTFDASSCVTSASAGWCSDQGTDGSYEEDE